MSTFAAVADIIPVRIWEGVVGRVVEGERMTLAMVELAADCTIPEHRHDNEQLGVCITGSLRFRVGTETRYVEPGDSWRIRSGVPHEVVTGPDGALVVECFAPARTDWEELERLEKGSSIWPR